MPASTPEYKKKVWLPVGIGFVAASVGLALDQIPFALLMFLILSSAGWLLANPNDRTLISSIGVAAVFAGAASLVVQASTNIEYWYVAKITFVIYFGVFAGHLITKVTGNSDMGTILFLVGLMFICFVSRLLGEPGYEGHAISKFLHGGGIYKWADFIEDAAFGLAGALAAELYGGQLKSSTATTSTTSPSPVVDPQVEPASPPPTIVSPNPPST
jgi:hypothetical protein